MEIREITPRAISQNYSLLFFVGLLGVLLNQSNVMFGFNLSLADLSIIFVVVLLLLNEKLELPVRTFILFFLFSFFILLNSTLFIPLMYSLPVGKTDLLKDFFKLIVSLLYFTVGVHIAKLGFTRVWMKSFYIASTVVGLIGISLFFLPHNSLSDVMLYYGSRMTGFMNDPNYFAVIQCAALAIAMRTKTRFSEWKIISITILILSIFSSGSKTGFITLFCFLCLRIFRLLKEGKLKGMNLFYLLIAVAGILLFSANLAALFTTVMNAVAERFPIFSRVQLLLTDFDQAVSAGGSSRNIQWETGWRLIQQNPLNGVGIGQNYLRLAGKITPDANIAHNTFIQMAAEWGLPIMTAMTFYIGKVFFSPAADKKEERTAMAVKEAFFAFIIGSLAVSFHYSRIFWLLLGMMSFYAAKPQQADPEKNLQEKGISK